MSGGRPHNLVLASVEWPVITGMFVLLPISLSYQRVCGRARGYQKGDTVAFYGSQPAYSRTILVSSFGLLLMAVVKERGISTIVLVLLMEVTILLLLLVTTIIVNQLLGIVLILTHII